MSTYEANSCHLNNRVYLSPRSNKAIFMSNLGKILNGAAILLVSWLRFGSGAQIAADGGAAM